MVRGISIAQDRGLYVFGRSVSRNSIPDSDEIFIHYDATQIDADNQDIITHWSDLSGNGHELNNYDGSPIYLQDGINGHPAVYFPNEADHLRTTFSTEEQPNHIFVVFQFDGTMDESYVYDGASENEQMFQIRNSSWRVHAGNSIDGGIPDEDPYISSALFNTTNSTHRVNGTEVASGDVGGGKLTGVTLGDRGDLAEKVTSGVRIAEFLAYRKNKSEVVSDVENYLSYKWNIPI